MAQRVMIAIALSCSPRLLIADEPTTAVDVTIQAQVLKLMKDLKAEVRASVLLITHNLGVVAETCDRVGVMYAGVMAEIGPTRSVFKEPLHPYTKGLMESIPRVTVEKDRLQIIHGNVPNLITPPAGCRFHPRCPAVMAHCGWASNEIRTRLEDLLETAPGDGGVRRLIRKWDDSDPAALALECSGNPKAVTSKAYRNQPPVTGLFVCETATHIGLAKGKPMTTQRSASGSKLRIGSMTLPVAHGPPRGANSVLIGIGPASVLPCLSKIAIELLTVWT